MAPGAPSHADAADLEVALRAAVDEGVCANVARWLAFRGVGDCKQGQEGQEGQEWIELQAIDIPDGRFAQTKFAHAADAATLTKLLEEADRWKAPGLYQIANCVDPAVATRRGPGRWHVAKKGESTSDKEMLARAVVFIDVDADRPKGTSATDAQLRDVHAVASAIFNDLAALLPTGAASLALGHSGNGRSLFIALDRLAETDQLAANVKGLLAAIRARYETPTVKIDPSVSDAKRLVPAFGTTKRKGAPGIAERPHRRTGILTPGPSAVRRLSAGELAELLVRLRRNLTAAQQEDVDRAMGRRPPTRAARQHERQNGPDLFAVANEIPIDDVLAWLGLGDRESPVCPGCGLTGDSSVSVVGNGVKCLHARCARLGVPGREGFRSAVDVVMEARHLDAREALVAVRERWPERFPAASASVATRPAHQAAEPAPVGEIVSSALRQLAPRPARPAAEPIAQATAVAVAEASSITGDAPAPQPADPSAVAPSDPAADSPLIPPPAAPSVAADPPDPPDPPDAVAVAFDPALIDAAARMDPVSVAFQDLVNKLQRAKVRIRDWRLAVKARREVLEDEAQAEQRQKSQATAAPDGDDAVIAFVKLQLLRDKGSEGAVRKSIANLITIMVNDPRWRGRLAYHALRESAVITKPIPWHPDDAGPPNYVGDWTDQDTTRATAWIAREWGLDVPSNLVNEAIETVARRDIIDPLQDYLGALRHDGQPRLDTWLSSYIGSPDTTYARAIGSRWMISAVARAYTPGCKADCAITLESKKQGIGKSSALRLLCPDESLFFEDDLEIGNKDAAQVLRGKWIVELGELSALSRSEINAQKNFISRRIDTYRPTHAKRARDFPRRCVFAGSTNELTYLKDDENRRHWPVKCGAIDLVGLARDRDQLWAEAVQRFLRSEVWHVDTPELRRLCEVEQELRAQSDPWEQWVGDWLDKELMKECQSRFFADRCTCPRCAGITTASLLSGALGMDKERQGTREEMKASKILVRFGWRKGNRARRNGSRVYPFYPPGTESTDGDSSEFQPSQPVAQPGGAP